MRVLVINNGVESLRRVKTPQPAARGIAASEIQAALAAPRGRGGHHTANGVTAVVVTPRGGQRVATVYRNA